VSGGGALHFGRAALLIELYQAGEVGDDRKIAVRFLAENLLNG